MEIENLENLYTKCTTSIGALEDVNYFDAINGYKKLLDKWCVAYQEVFNFEKALSLRPNKEVSLPHLGELDGFGRPAYINLEYPFPYNPPHIDINTSALIYERHQKIKLDQNKDYIIQIEGIDNAYYLFVNDKFVGFSNISHAIKRFDLNPYIVNGDNIIKLFVLKYTPSSYLEDQDKMRFSGIFRSIYLIRRPKNYLRNFKLETDIVGNDGIVRITLEKDASVKLQGFGENQKKTGNCIEFCIKNPKLWSAEKPFLYDMIIECNGEKIHQYVGIRKVEIKGQKFYINGQLVKLKGVNRHTSSLYGHSESFDLMIQDIKLFKQYNINAVRTSHYPANQQFYDLCDKFGIYVLSETDLESHGACLKSGKYDVADFADIISNPNFKDQIIEREYNNVLTNINHPCIVMWSFGNESGFSDIVDETIEEIKKIDNRPWHFECQFKYDKEETYSASNQLDVYSRMYPSISFIKDKGINLDKPFMLCEYCHAMGTSLGEIKDYINLMDNNDSFFAAFVWEWTNHYVVEDGLEKYGGDFGEKKHDGTFCIDGLVELDRKLTPQMYELREVYAPVEYKKIGNKIEVLNKYDFTDLEECRFEIFKFINGKKVSKKIINISAKPHQKATLFEMDDVDGALVYYTICVYNSNNDLISEKSVYSENQTFEFVEFDKNIIPRFELNERGLIGNLLVDNKKVLSNMEFIIARPYTSNDFIRKAWIYDKLKMEDARFVLTSKEGNVVKGTIKNGDYSFYDVVLKYEESSISIHAVKTYDDIAPLRFGIFFEMEDNYKNITYLGLKGESYIDRNSGNPFGYYHMNVSNNYRNIVPQSSNSHFGTKFMILDKDKLFINSNKEFSFNYDCFKISDYKKHRNEMVNTEKRYLIIDYKEKGVGTEACGPDLQPQYEINEKEINFDLNFKVVK